MLRIGSKSIGLIETGEIGPTDLQFLAAAAEELSTASFH